MLGRQDGVSTHEARTNSLDNGLVRGIHGGLRNLMVDRLLGGKEAHGLGMQLNGTSL